MAAWGNEDCTNYSCRLSSITKDPWDRWTEVSGKPVGADGWGLEGFGEKSPVDREGTKEGRQHRDLLEWKAVTKQAIRT